MSLKRYRKDNIATYRDKKLKSDNSFKSTEDISTQQMIFIISEKINKYDKKIEQLNEKIKLLERTNEKYQQKINEIYMYLGYNPDIKYQYPPSYIS